MTRCEGCLSLEARLEALEARLGRSTSAIEPEAIYSLKAAAARLGIGLSSLYEIVDAGDIAVVRLGSKKGFRIKGSDLAAFLDSRREGGPRPATIAMADRLRKYVS